MTAVLLRLGALPVPLVPNDRGRPSKSKRTGVSGTGLLLHTSNTFKGAGSRWPALAQKVGLPRCTPLERLYPDRTVTTHITTQWAAGSKGQCKRDRNEAVC